MKGMAHTSRRRSGSISARLAFCVLALAAVLPARAAVTIAPPAPTSADVLFATIDVPGGCTITSSTTIAGSLVRTDVVISGCIVGPPPVPMTEVAHFGPLPAGSYTYQVFFREEAAPPLLESELSLLIHPAREPAAVPALQPVALTVLATLLAIAAFPLLRR